MHGQCRQCAARRVVLVGKGGHAERRNQGHAFVVDREFVDAAFKREIQSLLQAAHGFLGDVERCVVANVGQVEKQNGEVAQLAKIVSLARHDASDDCRRQITAHGFFKCGYEGTRRRNARQHDIVDALKPMHTIARGAAPTEARCLRVDECPGLCGHEYIAWFGKIPA